MAGGRKQAPARVPNEGGPAKPGVKGKNFNRAEEEQLCRSVIFVSQDRIVGNQQKAGVFWERICEHYEDHRPDAPRPQRSLETKWGLIKHDVSSFCGVYAQVLRLNKSGTSVSDTLRRAKELYQQKSAKKQEFAFEHCWLLLKDHPKWADGWSAPKATSSMRVPAASASSLGNQCDPGRSSGGCVQSDAEAQGSQRGGICRPGGSKAAREESRSASAREGVIYAQAEATRTMAAAQMKKAALLEDQNMLLLMTMPDEKITTAEAREYMRLRRGDKLKKLRRKLAAEEARERTDVAGDGDGDGVRGSATKRRRQGQCRRDGEEGEGRRYGEEGDGSQRRRNDNDEGAGVGSGRERRGGMHQEGCASQDPEDDDGDGDCVISLAADSRWEGSQVGGGAG